MAKKTEDRERGNYTASANHHHKLLGLNCDGFPLLIISLKNLVNTRYARNHCGVRFPEVLFKRKMNINTAKFLLFL